MRRKNYNEFKKKLRNIGGEQIIIREGRCQRIKNSKGEFEYKQKGVDTYLTMDLMRLPIDYPKIKQIILIASDSDFVPIVNDLKKRGINVILYTYFDRKRDSMFSTSNFLLQSASRYEQLTKDDFKRCLLI